MWQRQSEVHSILPYLAMVLVVFANVSGNVLLKMGASAHAHRNMLFGLFGWQTLAGIICFASGVLFYAWALKSLDLHVAQVITALQFIGAVVAAAVFFGEHISGLNWVGITLIVVGILIAGH